MATIQEQRAALFNGIIQKGISLKKNKKDIARALMASNQFDIGEIGSGLEGFDSLGMFEQDEIEIKNITPQGFADSLNNVNQDELTATQNTAFGFGRRMNTSGEIIKSLENKIGEKGFMASLGQAIDEKQVGSTVLNRFVPEDFQKFDQARRDFINATLRRESGAAIAPSEFDNAEKQYFPVPGDSKEVLEQKRKNRELVTRNFLGEAGVKVPEFGKTETGEITGVDTSQKELFDRLMTHALANPNDEKSKKLLQMVDQGLINVETGEKTNQLGMASSPINDINEEEEDRLRKGEDKEGFLTRAGKAVGGFLGGEQIGEAIGEVAGTALAKFGTAGKQFEETVAKIEQDFQSGTIDQEKRDNLLDQQEQAAKEAFGYSGPSFKQLAGDVLKIGTTFVGGGALKGATGVAKLAGIGATAGVAEALTEEEDVTAGAIAGATIGGALGVFGKVAGKAGAAISRKIDDFTDLGGRAEKLATEILDPTKKELSEALGKTGKTTDAVKLFVKNVKKAKDFGELRANNRAITETLFDERNRLLSENNFDVTNYLKPLKDKITEIEKGKLATPAQITKMKDILSRETEWIAEQGKITRLDAQARKEAIQDLTQPLLKKKIAGNLAQDEANDKVALDAIRFGLKEAVEGGEKKIKDINSQYAGLLRIQELVSGQEALALKAKDQSLLQKVIAPVVDAISASTGAGSAAFVARQAAKQQAKLSTLTGKLEKLSSGKGGVFAEMLALVKKVKDGIASKEQGFIGNALDDLDEFTSRKPKAGLSIEEVPDALNEAIKSTEKSIRTLKGRGLKESSPQVKKLIKKLDDLRKQ